MAARRDRHRTRGSTQQPLADGSQQYATDRSVMPGAHHNQISAGGHRRRVEPAEGVTQTSVGHDLFWRGHSGRIRELGPGREIDLTDSTFLDQATSNRARRRHHKTSNYDLHTTTRIYATPFAGRGARNLHRESTSCVCRWPCGRRSGDRGCVISPPHRYFPAHPGPDRGMVRSAPRSAPRCRWASPGIASVRDRYRWHCLRTRGGRGPTPAASLSAQRSPRASGCQPVGRW